MPLIITELAITADGKTVVEITNTGGTDIDVTNFSVGTTVAVDGPSVTANITAAFGVTSIPAGATVTFGHSSLAADLDYSNPLADLVFDMPTRSGDDVGGAIMYDAAFDVVDNIGVNDGPDLGTDIVYTGLTTRSPDTDWDNTNNISEFTSSTPFTTAGFGTAVCFAAGTTIAIPGGDCMVEALKIGDPVLTVGGYSTPVKWIGRQTIQTRRLRDGRLCPVRIAAGALGDGLPYSDLIVTADHGMVLDGLVINAGALVNGDTIDFVPVADLADRITVYHVETEEHSVILANGAPAETFIDYVGRQAFDNYAEYLDLYGADRLIRELDTPRITARRFVPSAITARLGISGEAERLSA